MEIGGGKKLLRGGWSCIIGLGNWVWLVLIAGHGCLVRCVNSLRYTCRARCVPRKNRRTKAGEKVEEDVCDKDGQKKLWRWKVRMGSGSYWIYMGLDWSLDIELKSSSVIIRSRVSRISSSGKTNVRNLYLHVTSKSLQVVPRRQIRPINWILGDKILRNIPQKSSVYVGSLVKRIVR